MRVPKRALRGAPAAIVPPAPLAATKAGGPPAPRAPPRRSHGRDEGGRPASSERLDGLGGRGSGDVVVPAVVRHLGELIHDSHPWIRREAMALVVDLLDVALAAGRLDGGGAIRGDLLEALGAHLLREDDDRLVAHARAHPRAPDAVVAGGGPDERRRPGRDVAGELVLHQDGIRGPHFVRAGRKVLRVQEDDGRSNTGESLGEAGRPHAAVHLMPRDVEEVDRIERRLAPRDAGTLPELFGKARGVAHVGIRRAMDHLLGSNACRTASREGEILIGGPTERIAPRVSFRPLPVATWRTRSPRSEEHTSELQ